MKTATVLTIFMLGAISLIADTLQIGAFSLPYRFEDTNITDIVRYVVTNDVISFQSATTSFTPPFVEKNGNVTVDGENTPDIHFYRPRVFLDGIEFRIENGQTNCVIKQSLTDAAKAIESELPMRTNLAVSAQTFIDAIMDGSVTNRSIAELRSLVQVYRNDSLSAATEADGSDADVVENFVELRQHLAFFPLSILDSSYLPNGTNTCYMINARVDAPNEPSYARSISVFPMVFVNGQWCLCVFPY